MTFEISADDSGDVLSGAQQEPESGRGRTASYAFVALLLLAVLGLPLGWLWQAVTPNLPVRIASDGAYIDDNQPEQFFVGDGWFVILGLAFGILAAIGLWFGIRRLRGLTGLIVLVVGTTAAAVIAWRFGRQIGLATYEAGLRARVVGDVLSKPNDLRIGAWSWWPPKLSGVLLLPALGATLVTTLLAGWSRWPSLHPEAEPAAQPYAGEPYAGEPVEGS